MGAEPLYWYNFYFYYFDIYTWSASNYKKDRKKAKQILSICAKGGQTSLHRLHIGVRAFYKRLLVRSLMTNVQSTSLLTV